MEYVPTFTINSSQMYVNMDPMQMFLVVWFISSSLCFCCQVSPMEIKMVRPPSMDVCLLLDDVFHKGCHTGGVVSYTS